ncbi:hypothetical protein [Aquipuribacter nitratireducens]|uniref:Uncharacterized protein n=1 Tax=Aquipuribacter nitratireducens TaxID=650104 RepID=A0ABW0GJH6_9MICO
MEAKVLEELGDEFRPRATNGTTGAPWSQVLIPYRDFSDGWDDWPPIFTPMYAMYHGAVGHTIEFPYNPRSSALSVAERHERTRLNTAIARATILGNFEYANANDEAILADQIELFRRGAAGEDSRPIDDPLAIETAAKGVFPDGTAYDHSETYAQEYPRAYVLPAGEDQRSETAASRLVEFLVDNDVEVTVAKAPVRIGGVRYEAGTYVVDMHQAKRGLANTILDEGRDVTLDFPTMYDISGWSLGDLWGATVEVVETGDLQGNQLVDVSSTVPTGSFPAGRRAGYAFTVDSVEGVAAVNALAGDGLAVGRLDDGTFVVRGDAATVREVTQGAGLDVRAASAAEVGLATPVDRLTVGLSGPADEAFALREMGFDVVPVTSALVDSGAVDLADLDALYVGSSGGNPATTLNPATLTPAGRAALTAWLADGGTVVGRGSGGAAFNAAAGLLDVTVTAARGDANGTVAVVNTPDSPVTGDAIDVSFVSSPRVFSSVGAGVRVDQELAEGEFLLSGHWIGSSAFAGQPVVVSGTAAGADVTLFGTEPLYRDHPKGMFTQVAEALWR